MRAFIAIDLPAEIRTHLASVSEQLKGRGMKLTWVLPEQVHLTLKFFGELEKDDAPKVTESLRSLVAGIPSFDLTVGEIGTFPAAGRVNVVWVGVHASTELNAMQRQCDEAFAKIGPPPEDRAFAPHLTLGRNKDHSASKGIRAILAETNSTSTVTARIEGITFYESILDRAGPTHRALSKHSFAG